MRRCYLCGVDWVSGKDGEYRASWIEERLEFRAGCFRIAVLRFAIPSNYFQ